MKIMVTGSRHMAMCEHWKGDQHPCEEVMRHRYLMDRAMREHVHGLAALTRGALADADHPFAGHRLTGEVLELWHGDADGADKLAASYWEHYQFGPVHAIPANWAALGRRAGHFRNELLVAQMPEMLLAFPRSQTGQASRGTRDAMHQARQAGIPVHVYELGPVCPAILFPQ